MQRYVVDIDDYCVIRKVTPNDEMGITFDEAKTDAIEYIADMIISYTNKLRSLRYMTEETFPDSFRI